MPDEPGSFRVSPQQEQLWLAEPDGPAGRTQAVVRLEGPLDPGALRAALGRTVERHEILRTTFARRPGIRIPLQVVHDELAPSWDTVDGEVDEIASAELAAPLDFERGPLVRARLVRLGDERHALVLTLSALCADASSVPTLLQELVHHYGGDGALVDDPLQYADFAEWQHELLTADGDDAGAVREFWARFDGVTSPELPFATTSAASLPPEEVELVVDSALADAVSAQAARYGATAPVFVQAAWHALLARVTGAEEVTLGFVDVERRHADLEGALGAFHRPLPVGTDAAGQITFAELLNEVGRTRDEAAAAQDYLPAAVSAGLLVGFVATEPFRGRAGELDVSLERVVAPGGQLRLWLTCETPESGLRLRIGFDPGALTPADAAQLARRFERLLASAAQVPEEAVGRLALLGEEERRLLLVELNETAVPAPTSLVHELFAAQSAATPDRVAVTDEHGSLTYAELDARANRLAQRLGRAGVGPDVAVGLCTDRSVEMVVGLLGILKAGGAYLPLHFEHPPARIAHQLEETGARAIVTQEPVLARLPQFDGDVICLDRDRAALDGESADAPVAAVSAENLVYVIYTSGSTGTPKGVGVTHGNLANYVGDLTRRLGADAEPLSFGMVTAISTDLGNTAVFPALCSGGTLVLVSPTAAADAAAIAHQLEATPVDVLKITPSHLGALLTANDPRVLPRRWLVLGGERAPWDLVARVQALGGCEILNHYGPTETTVGSCTMHVTDGPGPYGPATVPIGRPISNTACYVVDAWGEPVPFGVPGRLLIGGAGVARGYVGQPELTAERFLPDPFSGSAGGRVYDTGDVARRLPDGAIEFLGRSDEQVKIRGYRIEPAEIETALRSHPAVHEAVVVARGETPTDLRLVAYCATDGSAGYEELRRHLADWVPDFMIPAAIIPLDSLPMTPSGKVDRLALPDPAEVESAGRAAYAAPSTPLEEAVAAIWSEVLGVERIGVDDDFFALGGHSLLATQVVAQVRSDFAVELPLHSLFTYPTVASLSAEIVRMMGDYEQEETAKLVAQLEGLSDEEAEQLLSGDLTPLDEG